MGAAFGIACGVLVVHAPGGRWLAADGAGVFRFEVLPDKIQYPTTRGRQGLALLVDTHGVSALVEPALRLGASLVVACGDYPAKMQGAFDLARHGVNVYFPTDLFSGPTALVIEDIQIEGKRRVSARDFANGARLKPGDRINQK